MLLYLLKDIPGEVCKYMYQKTNFAVGYPKGQKQQNDAQSQHPGFKMLKPVAKKTGCRVKILEKEACLFAKQIPAQENFFTCAAVFVVLFI